MFVPIDNVPREYAWGDDGKISTLLGRKPTGRPEAELWLGAHPGSPARILNPAQTGGAANLAEWIAARHTEALGELSRLPFLFKVLSAGAPLSLQAHPSTERAAAQFAAENAAGVPLDADTRNYKDPFHKPELIVAIEDGFEALCGVRPLAERAAIAAELELDGLVDLSDVPGTLAKLLRARDEPMTRSLVDHVVRAARAAAADSAFAPSYRLAERLNDHCLGDPGVVISLLLNFVTLRAGEALYLPAGNLHAYISGIGLELMAASDNVLRGGLTAKHIDVNELLAVADCSELAEPLLRPESSGNVSRYLGAAKEFELLIVRGAAELGGGRPTIALNLGTEAQIRGSTGVWNLPSGSAVFISPEETELLVESGDVIAIARPQAGWKDSQ